MEQEHKLPSYLHVQGNGKDSTEDIVQFCVADVRKRLNEHSHIPKKMFQRDPEDPSGQCSVFWAI